MDFNTINLAIIADVWLADFSLPYYHQKVQDFHRLILGLKPLILTL
jgi:hypothetical protein